MIDNQNPVNMLLEELAQGKTLRFAVLKHYKCENEGALLVKMRELKKMPEVQTALALQDKAQLSKEFVDSKLVEILREGKYPSGAPGIIKMAYERCGIKFAGKDEQDAPPEINWEADE